MYITIWWQCTLKNVLDAQYSCCENQKSHKTSKYFPSLVSVLAFCGLNVYTYLPYQVSCLNNYEWYEKCMPVLPETFLDSVIPHFLAQLQLYSDLKLSECKTVCPLQTSVYWPFFVVFSCSCAWYHYIIVSKIAPYIINFWYKV